MQFLKRYRTFEIFEPKKVEEREPKRQELLHKYFYEKCRYANTYQIRLDNTDPREFDDVRQCYVAQILKQGQIMIPEMNSQYGSGQTVFLVKEYPNGLSPMLYITDEGGVIKHNVNYIPDVFLKPLMAKFPELSDSEANRIIYKTVDSIIVGDFDLVPILDKSVVYALNNVISDGMVIPSDYKEHYETR
jgi:hypothetical protein